MMPFSRCLIAAAILLLTVAPVKAGVRFSIAEELPSEHYFMVKTDIVDSGLPGSHNETLDIAFLQAGEQKTLPVPATLSRLSHKVNALALHPAYYLASVGSKTAPNLLSTIELPPLKPASWSELLSSGAPLNEKIVGITAGAVNDHFRMILRDYLPAFDRAAIPEDLRRHLPLLRKLAAFAQTPQALQNSLQNIRHSNGEKRHDDASIINVTAQYRSQLTRRLQEIEAWLALAQLRRRPMHDWIENFHKPSYVFQRIMQDIDRRKILQMLQQSENPSHFRQHSWVNRATGVKFTFSLETRTSSNNKPGYRTLLHTDLNPRLGLKNNTAYQRKCFPVFVKEEKIGWQIK